MRTRWRTLLVAMLRRCPCWHGRGHLCVAPARWRSRRSVECSRAAPLRRANMVANEGHRGANGSIHRLSVGNRAAACQP